ncbi:hypothetical protein [Aureispira sp. CCB-QB1]|uniref:hypothetical protein n=1 Tax=Aureispira sp. CCB-QB1 TaxID=1313421 RepID=UPI0006973F1B|nr:hypothetical protein [Aureispira sp. CCB-QB1]
MKKSIAGILTGVGAIGLIIGVVMLFIGEFTEPSAWIGLILGIIFFSSGIGLLKTTRSTSA